MSNDKDVELQLAPPMISVDVNKKENVQYKIPVVFSFGNVEFVLNSKVEI